MEMAVIRRPTAKGVTLGDWLIDGDPFCKTLEDAVREVPGQPVTRWKINGKTAIPAGRYLITLETSPRFGKDTITINGVPGFVGVRVHGGNNKDQTEGCVIVGDVLDEVSMTIGGAVVRQVLAKLKEKVKFAFRSGEPVWLTIKNP